MLNFKTNKNRSKWLATEDGIFFKEVPRVEGNGIEELKIISLNDPWNVIIAVNHEREQVVLAYWDGISSYINFTREFPLLSSKKGKVLEEPIPPFIRDALKVAHNQVELNEEGIKWTRKMWKEGKRAFDFFRGESK